MTDISLFAAFAAGVLSFISPCVLPLVPAYISFISGASLDSLRSDENRWKSTKKVSVRSISFILGFSFVFILMGASATFVGGFLLEQFAVLMKIAGVIIIILGLHFLGVFRIKYLNYEKRLNIKLSKVGIFGAFIAGIAFAFGWTPCIGPILAGILTLAATKETISEGIVLLSFYSLGLGIPFFITGIAMNTFLGVSTRIKKHFKIIEIIAGMFLIIIGLLIVFDYFSIISGYIIQWFPFLQSIG